MYTKSLTVRTALSRALAGEGLPVITMVGPRFLFPPWQSFKGRFAARESNGYHPVCGETTESVSEDKKGVRPQVQIEDCRRY